MSTVESIVFFFSSRRRHTRLQGDWSSDVCSSDLLDRLFRRHEFHEARAGGERPARGVERGARHAVRTARHRHPAAVTLVHGRGELREPRPRPYVRYEHGPYGIGGGQPDVDHHDLAAPLAREQVAAAWAA